MDLPPGYIPTILGHNLQRSFQNSDARIRIDHIETSCDGYILNPFN